MFIVCMLQTSVECLSAPFIHTYSKHNQINKRQPLHGHFMLSVLCNDCLCHVSFCLYSGGILLTFTGDNLDVAQNPRLVLNGASVSSPNPPPYTRQCDLSLQSSCDVVNATLTCLVPPTNADSGQIQYSLVLDNAPFPDISDIEFLQLSSSPNPSAFTLIATPVSLEADSAIIRITVRNMHLMYKYSRIHTSLSLYRP